VIVETIEAIAQTLDAMHNIPVYVDEMEQNAQMPCFFIYATPLASQWISRDMKRWQLLFEIRYYHDNYSERYEMADSLVATFSTVNSLPCLKGRAAFGDGYIAYRFEIDSVIVTKETDDYDLIGTVNYQRTLES
jgi:hypothetical protein